jgi:hypothetical protein
MTGFASTADLAEEPIHCAITGVAQGKSLQEVYAQTRQATDPVFGQVFIFEHCIPFDLTRAYDEAPA